MSKAYDQKLEAIAGLRFLPDAAAAEEPLRKFLRKDKSNYVVSKAASVAGEMNLRVLVPDLVDAFDRFLLDAAKSDPQCWAKIAIIKSLKDLGHDDAAVYLRGMAHVQHEPVWGGTADTAGPLRGASCLALCSCSLPRLEILTRVVDLLADPEKQVRADAVTAVAQFPGSDTELLLRVKALAGDKEEMVVGQCFTALLAIAPRESIPFVARFLEVKGETASEAAAALGACPEERAVQVVLDRFASEKNPDLRRVILLSLGGSRLWAAAEFLVSIVAKGRDNEAVIAREALAASRFHDDERVREALTPSRR